MTITTCTITDTVYGPDGNPPANGRMRFELSSFDSSEDDVVTPLVVPITVYAAIDPVTGAFTAELWQNAEGLRGTVYTAYVETYNNDAYVVRTAADRNLGNFQIPADTASSDLSARLSAPVTVPEAWYSTITQAEYDAAIAAVTDAQAAQTAAELALDNFTDLYLGAKASDPTLDNDGDALQSGALYFNTTSTEMRVWDGATWVSATIAGLTTTVADLNTVGDLAVHTPDLEALAPDGAELNSLVANGTSYKNKIINGNFDIWQRSTSETDAGAQTNSGYVAADRWAHWNWQSGQTVTRQAFTLGQTDVPGNPNYFMRTVVSSTAGVASFVYTTQRIYDVRQFSSRNVTVSFWAKADSARDIAIELAQFFDYSNLQDVFEIGAQKFTLSATWQKFTATITLPSIAGKTVDHTAAPSFLELNIWYDAGSDYNARTNTLGQQSGTFDISQVQLEFGDVASEFELLSHYQVFRECLPYYERITADYQYAVFGIGIASSTESFETVINFTGQPRVDLGSDYTYSVSAFTDFEVYSLVSGNTGIPSQILCFTSLGNMCDFYGDCTNNQVLGEPVLIECANVIGAWIDRDGEL